MARSKELGVKDNFRALGIVTLNELQSLMVNAVALINASNFEGWSTTVEESKSLGLPIILSDIPVHIEQSPKLGRYFKAGSAEDLADVLCEALQEHDPASARLAREMAAAELPLRIREYAKAYEQIVTSTISGD
jgi:glycosyltransferase involved in cell wall biosynthesis